jgi:ankyrin repeat protein
MLLRAGARRKGGEMYSACKAGNREIVDLLLAHRPSLADGSPKGELVLEAACRSGPTSLVELAVNRGPSPTP